MLKIIPPAHVSNFSKTGLLQTLKGHIDESTGIWLVQEEKNEVYVPISAAGDKILRELPRDLAFNVDWNKAFDALLDGLRKGKLTTKQLERSPIEEILLTVGVLIGQPSHSVFINGTPRIDCSVSDEYRVNVDSQTPSMDIIDIETEVKS